MDDMEPIGVSGLFALLLAGALFGFIIGVKIDRWYITDLHWKDLVRRGYAEEIESSAGKVYRWKESGDDTKP